jgi:phage gpG-like protein
MSVIYSEWEPRPAEIEQALASVAAYVENVELPLLGARRIAMRDMRQHFDDSMDPDGRPWVELSDEYAAQKQMDGYGQQILIRETHLVEAATSEGTWDIIGEDLVFNANMLPTSETSGRNYGLAHQEGINVPQRAFIGLSDEAEAEITALFDQWYDNAGLLYIRPSGVIQTRVPTGRGRETVFGPKFAPEF